MSPSSHAPSLDSTDDVQQQQQQNPRRTAKHPPKTRPTTARDADAKVASTSSDGVTEEAPLRLDVGAVANIEGLAQEVAVLRASIRQLAAPDATTDKHVKILAELRHQVAALCTALKTQQALARRESSTRADELARVLDELGDELGVPR